MDRPRVLDKLRKLMALANDTGAAEGEVDNALRFARKLMDDHGVAEDEIILTEAPDLTARRVVDEELPLRNVPRHFHHYGKLGLAVGLICDVTPYWKTTHGREALRFFGFEHDVAVAKALFLELVVIMRTLARRAVGEAEGQAHHNYLIGFSGRLWERARALQAASQAQAAPGAIILRKDAARAVHAQALGLVKAKRSRQAVKDWTAYTAGLRDAERVDLSTNGLKAAPLPKEISS